MSHCWHCGKATDYNVAFCSIECKDNYRSSLTEDQKREQKEIRDDMQSNQQHGRTVWR